MHRTASDQSVALRRVALHASTRARCAVVMWLLGCFLTQALASAAEWVPFKLLPGGVRGLEIAGEFGQASDQGIVRDVRFDQGGDAVWFRKDGQWSVVDLSSGQIAPPGPDSEAPAQAARDSAPGAPMPPGRGRQRPAESSADGTRMASTQDGNLFVKCAEAPRIQVTSDATEGHRYATASWVYGEELDQTTGMWWNKGGSRLAFYDFDDSTVPQYHLLSGLTELRTSIESERYPKPGDPNPIARLMILDADALCADPTGDPMRFVHRVDVGSADQYIYGVEWSPSGSELIFHRLNRRHDVLELCAADPQGSVRVLVREVQPHWNNHMPEMRFLADGIRFIWSTEKSGFKQYELRSLADSSVTPLSSGNFPAGRIEAVRESTGQLFYTAFPAPTAINSQLMVARLDGRGCMRLTPDDAHYGRFRIAPDGRHFAASDESVSRAPSTRLYRVEADGAKLLATVASADESTWSDRQLPPPKLVKFKAADGITDTYGIVRYPSKYDPSKRWPLVVNVYGGPYFQNVFNRFASPEPECELGFVTLQLDNRGTPGRGKAFEDATYMQLGIADLDDQAAAVKQLCALESIDPDRVGIKGMSYGGYMSALALVRHPETFAAAVAQSGPMDWRQYDTIYTERFMRMPSENEGGYDAGSVLVHAGDLKGDLLLIHGMQDDNVHPSNGWALAQKLYSRNFPFEMLFFPRAGHGGFGNAGEDASWSFLVRHLGATPGGGGVDGAP